LPTPWKQKQGQLARLRRDTTPDDPRLTELRQEMRALRLADHVEKVISEFPPLTREQIDRVAAILRGGGHAA
jgi:hypothetical protein